MAALWFVGGAMARSGGSAKWTAAGAFHGEAGTTYSETAAGGATLGGAATNGRVLTETPVGGVALSGSATVAASYVVTATSGVTLAGAGTESQIFNPSPSGGASLAGSATVAYVANISVSGGVVLGGAGTVGGGTVYTEVGTGGVELGGAAIDAMAELNFGDRPGPGIVVLVGGQISVTLDTDTEYF